MADITVSNDVDTLLQSSDKAAIRVNAGLGSSDTVEFGGVVLPAGTTAEINAVSDATVGQLMVDTDKGSLVRFTGAATYDVLGSDPNAENYYQNSPDTGATDFATQPQSWANGGIVANNVLGTAAPLRVSKAGKYEVTLRANLTAAAGVASTEIRASLSGSSQIIERRVEMTKAGAGAAFISETLANTTPSSYTLDFSEATFSHLTGAGTYSFSFTIIAENLADTNMDVTYDYTSTTAFADPCDVNSIEIKKIA